MKHYCTHVSLLGSEIYHTYILGSAELTHEADAERNV